MTTTTTDGGAEPKLFYHGTDVDVRLGDRFEMKRFLRKPIRGTVVYMPGVSPPNPGMEWPEFSRWGVQLDDGTMLSWPYLPAQLQPEKRLLFVSRGDPHEKELRPEEELT
jgi:hypothetical protein